MTIDRLVLTGLFALLASAAGAQPPAAAPAAARTTYVLGADDVIGIRATDAEEISDKAIRIGANGTINLPMVGRVQAGGLTTEDLEKKLVTLLKPFVRMPEVSVNLVEMRSQPVSVIGAVGNPGVQQLQGRKTLVEMLSLAGGVRVDSGYSVKITRSKEWGAIPLRNATEDPTGQFTVAEVNLKEIMEAKNPANNIPIMPNDVISVPRGDMVYVVGDVKRSGGFVLGEKARISVLQALSLAAGLERTASASNAKILRADTGGGTRTEVPVNLKNILAGKDQDVPMEPDDILFVPGSKPKAAIIRGLEAALQVGTGLAIYRTGN
jgi:polysaccharide biosynthesis/export protein